MQALEMESVSLINSRNQKKLGKQGSTGDDVILAAAMRKNFMTKVMVVAVLAILALFYVASADDAPKPIQDVSKVGGDGIDENPAVVGTPAETPVAPPVPVSPPTETPVAATTDAPVAAITDAPVESPVEAPVETPAEDKATDSPTAAPVEDEKPAPASTARAGKKLFADGEYMYRNFAEVKPLIDHPLPDDETREKIEEQYGKWGFFDGDEDNRPTNDYLAPFPNRDMPGDEMPEDAWQVDAVFVNHYLDAANNMLSKAVEAIYEELGHPKPPDTDGQIARKKMLHWSKVDLSGVSGPPPKYAKKGDRGDGGWTTERSFDGLVLRLLHAMMTSDTFTVVMGGHSAAAGQGNHFRQSYMMQFHKVLEPIFARLGVKLITRNVGMGGLGTVHNGLGSGSIYGDEVDLLIWDSGMTEGQSGAHVDIFLRQGLIGGNRVPVVWGGNFDLLKMLHEEADADVGEFGWGTDALLEATSQEEFDALPYSQKGMKCEDTVKSLCDAEPRFCAKCWIDREDGIKPEKNQIPKPKGQVNWHPGWRMHQLIGRTMAMGVLSALQAAVNKWNENVMGGPPLADEYWHVTDYYDNIREKVKNLDKALGECYKDENLPDRVCNTPMKARTQYTPRANPEETSLTSIIKPTADGYVPKNEKKALYEGPDAHNECYDLPEGAIDIFDVMVTRRRLDAVPTGDVPTEGAVAKTEAEPFNIHTDRQVSTRMLGDDEVVPGKGWEIWGEPQGYCDGTYNAVCSLESDNECALYGHHDARGGIIGNEFSGWLVLTLEDLKEGLIMIKLHTWHSPDESTMTKDWTSVNNEPTGRRLRERNLSTETVLNDQRSLGVRSTDTVELPDTFVFEYAIDGKVTSLSKADFLEKNHHIQRVVEILTLLDDKEFTSEPKDVEVAIRMKGCERVCTFALTHIYWA